jgi:malto-oligosyltrehalose trehalohydrolase
MPFGAELTDEGVRFAIWAPGAHAARVHIGDDAVPMTPDGGGFFRCTTDRAGAGTLYSYSFDDRALRVPDPASRFNPHDVHGPSEVIDPAEFAWDDGDWRGRSWHDAVIYELHVGTFTREGTYAAAERKLDYLAELGVTAIELMPLADTPGKYNWGYDGVLAFAPESAFGRPGDLKRLVAAAHRRGLMMLLDVVYNHFGPDGNYLGLYAPKFFTDRHHTPWGNGINFDGVQGRPVRDFLVHNALYWLEEFHFDGLRLDAVHAILDDSEPDFLTELAERARALDTGRRAHLVLENDRNAAHYLARGADERPRLYTAQWNDDFHHALHVLLTGERRGHYQDYERPCAQLLRTLTEGFAFQGEVSAYRGGRERGERSAGLPPDAFVNFLQNHDQIGNRPDGKRLWQLIGAPQMAAAETLLFLLPTPILIFMGDEFHAETPFLFFCDFHAELAAAVTEGRKREFGKLASQPEDLDRLPGPNTPEAHDATVLDWQSLAAPQHAAALARHRRLLATRGGELAPRLPARSDGGRTLDDCSLRAHWRLADGARLTLTANLSAQGTRAPRAGGRPLAATAELADGVDELPAWYVGWTLEG